MLQLENGQLSTENWQIAEEDALLPDGPVLIPLERYTPEMRLKNSAQVGVILEPDADPALLKDMLEHLPVIALRMPNFKDGRAFTQARALREYFGYTGKIHLIGRTLPDHYEFMIRCGIDRVTISEEADLPSWQEAYQRYSIAYQKSILEEPQQWGMRRWLTFRENSSTHK